MASFIGKRKYKLTLLMLSVVPLVAVAAVILGGSSGNIKKCSR
jgi:hypothetical protein